MKLFVSAPIEDRINDTVYTMNPYEDDSEIYKMGITVTDVKHTNNRAKMENIYYWVMTHI